MKASRTNEVDSRRRRVGQVPVLRCWIVGCKETGEQDRKMHEYQHDNENAHCRFIAHGLLRREYAGQMRSAADQQGNFPRSLKSRITLWSR